MKLAGTIYVDYAEYKGSGEAVLFLRKKDEMICDKIMYLSDVKSEADLVADEFHKPLKVMLSCYEACVPSLNMKFKLENKKFEFVLEI